MVISFYFDCLSGVVLFEPDSNTGGRHDRRKSTQIMDNLYGFLGTLVGDMTGDPGGSRRKSTQKMDKSVLIPSSTGGRHDRRPGHAEAVASLHQKWINLY